MSDVRITLDARLDKIEAALGELNKLLTNTSKNIENTGKQIEKTYGDGFRSSTKHAENFMARLGGIGRRTLRGLGDDFKALFSINALRESLKMSDKFRDRAIQVMSLNDAIRKMGGSFGLAAKDFGRFQADLQKGLGDVGVSSEAAANALEGLMGSQVKGEQDLIRFAKQAGMIAALTGEAGQEASVVKGMADVALKGFSPEQIADSVTKMFTGGGMRASESVALMHELFATMTPQQMQNMGGLKGVEDLAVIMQTSGKETLGFLKQLVQAGVDEKRVFESMGAKDIFGEKGFNASAFRGFVENMKRMRADPKAALEIAPAVGENAAALLKLEAALDKVEKRTKEVNQGFISVEHTLQKNRGFAESFSAAINKVFGNIPLSRITQPLTEAASKMSESTTGSVAMVGGSAILAALLAGGGLRGIGKAIGIPGIAGGMLKGKALEQAGVQPVYVVNASEIGGGGISNLAKLAPLAFLGKGVAIAAATAAVGTAAYAAYSTGAPAVKGFMERNNITIYNPFEGAIDKLMGALGLSAAAPVQSPVVSAEPVTKRNDVKIIMADPRLKEVHSPTRGGSFE